MILYSMVKHLIMMTVNDVKRMTAIRLLYTLKDMIFHVNGWLVYSIAMT